MRDYNKEEAEMIYIPINDGSGSEALVPAKYAGCFADEGGSIYDKDGNFLGVNTADFIPGERG